MAEPDPVYFLDDLEPVQVIDRSDDRAGPTTAPLDGKGLLTEQLVDQSTKARWRQAHDRYCFFCLCRSYRQHGSDQLPAETVKAMAASEHLDSIVSTWRDMHPLSASLPAAVQYVRKEYDRVVRGNFHTVAEWSDESIMYHLTEINPATQMKHVLGQSLERAETIAAILASEMVTEHPASVDDATGELVPASRSINSLCVTNYLKVDAHKLAVIRALQDAHDRQLKRGTAA